MTAVWRFIRKWWWTFLLGAAAVAGFFFYLLFPKPQDTESAPGKLPRQTLKDRAKEEVERVQLEGEIERARAVSRADTRREELDAIETTGKTDPAEGRRQLAAWMAQNL